MHDVESFAEQMVHLVDENEISNEEKIDLIHNIYKFHDSWDTGFTKLRVNNILIKTGYFRLFERHEHPDYEKYKDFFDGLPDSNEMYIYEDPIAGYSEDAKLTSYWFENSYDSDTEKEFPLNKMCCEAGSPVWAYFEGADKMPKDIPLISLFSRLAELAAEKNDIYAMGQLYFIMLYGFIEFDGNNEEEVKCVEKMKPVLFKDEVMATLKELYLDHSIGSREDFEEMDENESTAPFMREWFDYYFNWKEQQPASKDSGRRLFGEIQKMADDFRAKLLNGEIDEFFKEINMEFKNVRNLLMFNGIYANIMQEGHEKIISYDVSQAQNEETKSFVADYKEWYENKENVNYFIDKARECLNVNMDALSAQYYIREGLSLDPANTTLKLYEIYGYVNYIGIDHINNNVLKYQLGVLSEILEDGLGSSELKAFAYYLKASILHRLNETEASKVEMKKAIELNTFYTTTYEQFFGKDN